MARASLVRRLAERRGWGEYFGYSRNVYLLLLFTLGKGFQLSIAAVSINLYVYSLTHDEAFAGVVASMPALGALISSVPVGFLADRVGRKPLLVISGFLNPLALAAIGLSTDKTLIIIASLCNGFLSSAYWVTNLPILVESTTEDQRVGVLALNNFLLLGVGALGALVGGAVPELVAAVTHLPADSPIPLRFGVLAAALVVLLPAIPLLWLDESERAAQKPAVVPAADVVAVHAGGAKAEAETALLVPAAPAAAAAPPQPMGRWGVTRLFLQLLIPDILFTTGEGAVVGLLQIFFLLKFGMQPGALGILYTVAGLIGGATSLTAPRFVRRYGQLRLATTMQYLSAPMMLAIGFMPFLPLAAGAEFGRQILRGLFEPTYAAFAMGRVSRRYRATLSGFYSVTWSIGYSIGPTIAGILMTQVGLSVSFVVGAGCVVLSATLLRAFFGRGDGAPVLE